MTNKLMEKLKKTTQYITNIYNLSMYSRDMFMENIGIFGLPIVLIMLHSWSIYQIFPDTIQNYNIFIIGFAILTGISISSVGIRLVTLVVNNPSILTIPWLIVYVFLAWVLTWTIDFPLILSLLLTLGSTISLILYEYGIRDRKLQKEYDDFCNRETEDSQCDYDQQMVEKTLSTSQIRRNRMVENGGSYTPAEWTALFDYFQHHCLHPECLHKHKTYPKKGDGCIQIDHIISVKNGGSSNIDNLQPLCRKHNVNKSSKNTDHRLNAIEYLNLDIGTFYKLKNAKQIQE